MHHRDDDVSRGGVAPRDVVVAAVPGRSGDHAGPTTIAGTPLADPDRPTQAGLGTASALSAPLVTAVIAAMESTITTIGVLEDGEVGARTSASTSARARPGADVHRVGRVAEPGGPPLVAGKVLGEAALLLRSSHHLTTIPLVARAWDRLAAATVAAHDPTGLVATLCMDPGAAWDRAFTHLHLRALGLVGTELDPLLTSALSDPGAQGQDMLASMRLERRWLTELWDTSPPVARTPCLPPPRRSAPSRASWVPWPELSASPLGRGVDVLGVSTTDLYLLTHAAMYASDVGQRRVRAAITAADADAALAIALDDDNLDLACEVLWLWPMLGLPVTPTAAFGMALVEAARSRHGLVPGPDHDPIARARLSAPDQRRHDVRTSSHATLVHGMLCAALLRHPVDAAWGSAWSRSDPSLGDRGGSGHSASERVEAGRLRRWEVAHDQVDGHTRSGLAGLELTVAVRRAAAGRDLAAMHDVVERAVQARHCDLPAVAQAVGVLQRATMVARNKAFCA